MILEVTPALQTDPSLFDKLYLTSPLTGQQVPLSAFVKIDTSKTAYLTISHQGQFPAVTISFNLAPGVALGQAVTAINKAQAEMGVPADAVGLFQGTAKAFPTRSRTQPYLIAAALIAVYIVLGLLYESFIHPLTILSTLPSAGLGALLILMAGRLRPQRDRADRHHSADRHRQEERHHDGRLRAHGRARAGAGAAARRSTRPACCAFGRS